MKKKKKSNPYKLSERPSKKHKGEKSDKRYPNPEDYNEEKGPPIKEMPVTDSAHQEEIPDRRPD